MAIIINLDVMLAKRKVRSRDLAEALSLTETNLSLLKTGLTFAIYLVFIDFLGYI